jgi:PHD/YefM family antitoxin component YafN of YafNO toxin-antitoxin module
VKTLELKNASKPLADYAAKLGVEGLVITSRKKPVAALVSLKDADLEGLSLSMNPAFLEIIRQARAEIRRGKVVSLKQIKQALANETTAPGNALHRARRKASHR